MKGGGSGTHDNLALVEDHVGGHLLVVGAWKLKKYLVLNNNLGYIDENNLMFQTINSGLICGKYMPDTSMPCLK